MELPNRQKLEARFGRRIQQLNNRHMKELLVLIGNPPDFSKVTESFWTRVEQETKEETAGILLLLFQSSAMTHLKKGGAPLDGFMETLDTRATTYAEQQSSQIGRRQAERARTRLRNAAEKIAESDDPSKREVLEKMEPVFSPGEARNLSREETTRARHVGSEEAVGLAFGLSDDDIWLTRAFMSRTGPCPICAPLDGTTRDTWSKQFPLGPPTPHVGCVCVIEYALERNPVEQPTASV